MKVHLAASVWYFKDAAGQRARGSKCGPDPHQVGHLACLCVKLLLTSSHQKFDDHILDVDRMDHHPQNLCVKFHRSLRTQHVDVHIIELVDSIRRDSVDTYTR